MAMSCSSSSLVILPDSATPSASGSGNRSTEDSTATTNNSCSCPSSSSSTAAATTATHAPRKGDVRQTSSGRWVRYNGKEWRYKCEEAGCASHPIQGFKEDQFPRFCGKHRRRGCIRMTKRNQCSRDGCRKQPSFALPGMKAARCRRHALDGEINVVSKRCRFGGCDLLASFGVDGKRDWCKKHAPTGSTANVSASQICHAPGCTTRASFGTEWRKPKHCSQHATDDEDNCMVRRCLAPLDGGGECLTRPIFGPRGGRKVRCATHREVGHVNLASRRCARDGCDKLPSFGTKATGALYCVRHKRVGDTNVVKRKCAIDGCNKAPFFGTKATGALFCVKHKRAGDTDVVNKKCSAEGCEKRPSYGTKATGALFCSSHRRAGDTDVVNKKCSAAGCEKRPSYGPAPETEGGPRKKLRCANHAIATDVQNSDKRAAGFGRPAPRFRGGRSKSRSPTRKRAAIEVRLDCW